MQTIQTARVKKSPLNPRKSLGDLAELAASIRSVGILQPIVVRPIDGDDDYECVCGHRRLAAAEQAGLKEIPAIVRELSDAEVLEAMLVENAQREGLHPLEEGAAYLELHEKCGYDVDEIAAKIGKSRSTVYARMKLCGLCDSARKALLEGKLEASTALLIARIPSEKVQAEALKKLQAGRYGRADEPYSYRDAAELLQREYMLRLEEAKFDRADAELVANAGPCTTCPKRTGAQPELFGDVKSPDVCTDPPCYALKRDAAWKIRAHEAKAAGQTVLSDKEAKAVFSYNASVGYSSGYLDLDGTEYIVGRQVAIRKLVKKAEKPVEVVLARDTLGNPRELVSRKAIEAIVRKQTKKDAPANDGVERGDDDGPAANDSWRKEAQKRQRERLVTDAVMQATLAAIARDGMNEAYWKAWLEVALLDSDPVELAEARGWVKGDCSYEELREAVRKGFAGMNGPARAALLLELAWGSYAQHDEVLELAKAYRVDAKAIEEKVKADEKAAKKAAAAEAKAAEAKPAGKGKAKK
jgi:ParB/RepB/Spo0J family partition protein